MILDAIVALAVWPLGLWLVHALPWPDAAEDDAGYYPVLGSLTVVLGWLAFAGVPSIVAIVLIEWLRGL